MAEDLQRILECPMCFELYDSAARWPKLLPCQHTFCQPCLALLDRKQQICCPQCRIDHISPQGGAKQLPNNFTMLSLIDLHGKTSSVSTAAASDDGQCAQEQTKINENVRNAIGGLAQQLQEKASDLGKIDTKRKHIEEKFLGVKAKLDAAFDARAKELQTRREALIKQLASLRQEELNFLEGQKASATQYLQKFQQDFAGMKESLLGQQRLPNESELTNLLTMCRGYIQQIDMYALNIDQKDRSIAFIDHTKLQLTISINGYGCVNVKPGTSTVSSPSSGVVGGVSDAINSSPIIITNNIVQAQQLSLPNAASTIPPQSTVSAPPIAPKPTTTNNSNSNFNRSTTGQSDSSQYMFPPAPRSALQMQGQSLQRAVQSSSSTVHQGSNAAPLAAEWAPPVAQDARVSATSQSTTPYSSRSTSPSPSVSSMISEFSGERRRSLNPFLQDPSPTSLSQSQAMPSLSPSIQSGSSVQKCSSTAVIPSRGHSPLPSRQISVGALSTPTQSASRPTLTQTRHASLDLPAHSQQSVNVPYMASITEHSNNSWNSSQRRTSVDSASTTSHGQESDVDYSSPPPLPPRKGAKANSPHAANMCGSTKQWVKFDTLRRNSSPTKSQSVSVISKDLFGDSLFEKPVGAVSLPNNLIAVLDECNHCILIVSETGQLVRTLGSKGNGIGQFQFPRGICTNTAGHVVVSDWFNNRIQLWEPSGKFVRQFGVRGQAEGNLDGPVGVVCDQSDNIYVCDYNNHCVKVFNAAGGFIRQIGKHGQGDSMFKSPSHIVISLGGELLITDAGKHCVQVFTKQGTFLYAVGQYGTASGQLNFPTGITIDQQGYLYVANSGNNRIEVFNPSGSFSMSLGTQGKEDGQFSKPLGVATTQDGRLIVCDSGNKRLQILWP